MEPAKITPDNIIALVKQGGTREDAPLVQQIQGYKGLQKGMVRKEEMLFTQADQKRLETVKDKTHQNFLKFKKQITGGFIDKEEDGFSSGFKLSNYSRYVKLFYPDNIKEGFWLYQIDGIKNRIPFQREIVRRYNLIVEQRLAKSEKQRYKKNFEERAFEFIMLMYENTLTEEQKISNIKRNDNLYKNAYFRTEKHRGKMPQMKFWSVDSNWSSYEEDEEFYILYKNDLQNGTRGYYTPSPSVQGINNKRLLNFLADLNIDTYKKGWDEDIDSDGDTIDTDSEIGDLTMFLEKEEEKEEPVEKTPYELEEERKGKYKLLYKQAPLEDIRKHELREQREKALELKRLEELNKQTKTIQIEYKIPNKWDSDNDFFNKILTFYYFEDLPTENSVKVNIGNQKYGPPAFKTEFKRFLEKDKNQYKIYDKGAKLHNLIQLPNPNYYVNPSNLYITNDIQIDRVKRRKKGYYIGKWVINIDVRGFPYELINKFKVFKEDTDEEEEEEEDEEMVIDFNYESKYGLSNLAAFWEIPNWKDYYEGKLNTEDINTTWMIGMNTEQSDRIEEKYYNEFKDYIKKWFKKNHPEVKLIN